MLTWLAQGFDTLFSAFCTLSVCGVPLGDGGFQEWLLRVLKRAGSQYPSLATINLHKGGVQ